MPIVGAFIVPHPPIILPEVGHGEERKINKTAEAYREVARRVAALKPETIVLTSPHATVYADYFHISPGQEAQGDMSQFGAADVRVKVKYDTSFVQTLADDAARAHIPAGTMGERHPQLDHATLIPLRFIQQVYSDFRLVRIGISGLSMLDHYELGKCIARTVERTCRRVVFVASGDLSHKLRYDGPYGFAMEGPQFDKAVTDAMATGDFLKFLTFNSDFCENAAECGLGSFQIMAGALDGKVVVPELLSYEGPFGVGYGVACFGVGGDDEARCFAKICREQERQRLSAIREKEDQYVKLARLSLETYVKTGHYVELPLDLPDELVKRQSGAFVSLKKYGRLRGCIGTIAPASVSLAEEILHNAVSAGTADQGSRRCRKTNLRTWSTMSTCCQSRSRLTLPQSWMSNATVLSSAVDRNVVSCCQIWTVSPVWSSRSTLPVKRAVSSQVNPANWSALRWCGTCEDDLRPVLSQLCAGRWTDRCLQSQDCPRWQSRMPQLWSSHLGCS